MPSSPIAILGAGPMGLGAAQRLARDGHPVVVFEADDRIGGQSASFDLDGLEIERFFHYHFSADTTYLALLEELGLGHQMRWSRAKMGFFHQGQVSDWGGPLALLRFPGMSWTAKLRYGLHAFASASRSRWQGLDGQEATVWIKRWTGREAYDVAWSKLFEHKFHHHADRVSAAWIWSRIHRIAHSRDRFLRPRLGYLEGGSGTLLKALQAAIETGGGRIRLNSRVERVRIEDGRVTGIESTQGFEPFDKVISTLPLPALPALLPGLDAAALAKLQGSENIGVVCVVAKLRRPVSGHFWLNVNDADMDLPGLIEVSNLRPMPYSVIYVPFYLPSEHPQYRASDADFADKVRRYVRRINPALADEDFLATKVSRYRYAQPICRPGHLERLAPIALPARGLWAADTSYYYPQDRSIDQSLKLGQHLAALAEAG